LLSARFTRSERSGTIEILQLYGETYCVALARIHVFLKLAGIDRPDDVSIFGLLAEMERNPRRIVAERDAVGTKRDVSACVRRPERRGEGCEVFVVCHFQSHFYGGETSFPASLIVN